MLPSMPILFTRESQDAFGNKIEPSTSFFNPTSEIKPAIKSEDHSRKTLEKSQTNLQNGSSDEIAINKTDVQIKTKVDDNPLETALVRSYYTKVQSRFASYSSLPTNKFKQFQEILKTFDPMKETPVELFKKVEQIFGNEHKDLVEEFLLFLKPGQAVEVGRFMDHFMLVQITGFIKLLNTTFSRKPTVLRKILRAISTGINGSGDDLKTRILPHLRSSPRLMQMFKSLFPETRPPDSVYEANTDTINESFLTCDKEYDVWEFPEDNRNKRKPNLKDAPNSEYLHGRVFIQHGRLLRSACVTYPYSKEPYRSHARRLAPDHCMSQTETDTERSSPKKNSKSVNKIPPKRTRKPLKSPTKNVKDFNDNTKRDCLAHALHGNKVKGKPHSKGKVFKKDDAQKKKIEIKNTKSSVDETAEIKVENKNWTRNEDKTMLEILKGESGSEQVFERIREVLPHRTISEIKDRLHHVLNLLHEMAIGDIT